MRSAASWDAVARDPLIGRTVALKTIRLDGCYSTAERDRLRDHLLREARSAGALSHPNLVTIYDSGVEGDLAFIAMERLDGPTLQQRFSTGEPLDREEALEILRQAAAALDYAHQAGVVHRDIKASNIMFHHGATVKITDFGVAKIASTEQPTRTGMPMGTPSYMSPEQIQGHPVDGRSDQFSLAVVAFEMLTGCKPFQADSVAGIVHEIVYGERPSARSVVAEFPSVVDEVFNRSLAKDSRDRYSTCAEFVTALETAFANTERRIQQPHWMPHVSLFRRHWRWLVGIVVILLLMAWFGARSLEHRLNRQDGASKSTVAANARPVVLHRDFEKLGLRTEAYLDNRPDSPHRDDGTWRYVPAPVGGLSNVTQVVGGWEHSLALTRDGSLWAWGNGNGGELGDGTTASHRTPIRIASGAAGFIAVAAGSWYSLALKNDGTVWAWGGLSSLGDGTTTDRWVPVQVQGLSGIVAIAAGARHGLALKSDGSAWDWGWNGQLQLGDGTKTDRGTPARIEGLTGIAAVRAGEVHSLALKNDGSVWAWGGNTNGRLGDGTTTNRATPVRVRGISGVVAIAAGSHHNLALKNDGSVWAWGEGHYGQLGDGTAMDRWLPVRVSGLSGVTAIAAGAHFSFAVKSDGTVWTWGQNYYGALGDGTTTPSHTPVPGKGVSGIVAIAAGGQHGLARKSDGSLWTWGWNDYGQLGREAIQALDYDAMIAPASTKSSRTAYLMPKTGFPWVQFDKNLHEILLHPGKGATAQWAASVGFDVTADDQYTVSGAYRWASVYRSSGYGVDFAVILDADAAHPLYDGHFGSGDPHKCVFYIRKRILRGQVIRFVVFSGPDGKDASLDDIALEATIER